MRFCDVTTADACGVVRARSSLCCGVHVESSASHWRGHPEPRNRSYNFAVVTVPVRERDCRACVEAYRISHDSFVPGTK